jgi:hypothetical protein
MANINLGRVVLGGLLAGVVLNVGESILNIAIVGGQWEEAMVNLGLEPAGTGSMVYWIIYGFVMGIAMVWLYAGLRPRLGPGPKTAAITGLFMWFVAWLLPSLSFGLMGLFPMNLMAISIIWGVFEVPIAAVAGAWLYTEGGAPAATG